MRLLATPTFRRAVKKLRADEKEALDAVLRSIAQNPQAGDMKVGDLAGVRVFKFRLKNQICLLAYTQEGEEALKLLALGSHENFYRDLKR
ncbi:MAG: type II toxin-antitoxin system RelE/ParE family toxin [Rhodospirillales bacterium]|nr:type II toxin-antitoxin system RelE/ParE family toxin [Rhodospirillales bacterium]